MLELNTLNRDISTICVYLQTYGGGFTAVKVTEWYSRIAPFSNVLLASDSEVYTWFKVYSISITVSADVDISQVQELVQ